MYGITWGSLPYAGSPTVTYPAAGTFENVLFMTGEISDAATLATGTTALMAVANLQDKQPGKKWRSAAATTADYIDITLAEPLAANGLVLNATNFSDGAWLRARAYPSAADRAANTNVVVDQQGSAWPLGFKPKLRSWPRFINLLRWANEVSLVHWRIDLSDPGAAGGYLEAGRLVLDRYLQPDQNPDHDGGLEIECFDAQTRTPFGNLYSDPQRTGRLLELKFSAVSWRDALDIFTELQRRRGQGKDIICILYPAETTDFQQFAVHGLIMSIGRIVPVERWDDEGRQAFSFSITISELLD